MTIVIPYGAQPITRMQRMLWVIGEKVIGNDSVLAQLIRWFGRKKNVEKVGQAVSLKIDDRKFQE